MSDMATYNQKKERQAMHFKYMTSALVIWATACGGNLVTTTDASGPEMDASDGAVPMGDAMPTEDATCAAYPPPSSSLRQTLCGPGSEKLCVTPEGVTCSSSACPSSSSTFTFGCMGGGTAECGNVDTCCLFSASVVQGCPTSLATQDGSAYTVCSDVPCSTLGTSSTLTLCFNDKQCPSGYCAAVTVPGLDGGHVGVCAQ